MIDLDVIRSSISLIAEYYKKLREGSSSPAAVFMVQLLVNVTLFWYWRHSAHTNSQRSPE